MLFIQANYDNPTKLFNISISLTVIPEMKDLMKSIDVVLLTPIKHSKTQTLAAQYKTPTLFWLSQIR